MHRSVCHFSPCQTKTPDPILSIGKSGSAGFTGNWPTKHMEQPQRHKHDSARTQNCTDMSHGIYDQWRKFPYSICRTSEKMTWPQTTWTLWPSGLRRWLKAPFRKGVGSNPTGVIFATRLSSSSSQLDLHICRSEICLRSQRTVCPSKIMLGHDTHACWMLASLARKPPQYTQRLT